MVAIGKSSSILIDNPAIEKVLPERRSCTLWYGIRLPSTHSKGREEDILEGAVVGFGLKSSARYGYSKC